MIQKLGFMLYMVLLVFIGFFTSSCGEHKSLSLSQCGETGQNSSLCAQVSKNQVSKKTFSWHEEHWTSCSRACGGGVKTKIILCRNGDENTVPDSECTGVKPTTKESCNTQACTSSYSWNTGPWGNCSAACGGHRKRVVLCQSNDEGGGFVESSKCKKPKPSTTKACTDYCTKEKHHWVLSQWNQACSCGIEEITRTATCRSVTTNALSPGLCDETLKPETTKVCPQNTCSSHSWVTGSWSTCNKTCGGGKQTRSLGCIKDKDGSYTAHGLCDQSQRPQTERTCQTQACPQQCTQRTFAQNIEGYDNQLDLLLVIDDSGSMYKDSAPLATKLSGFIDHLESSNINWQMCITTTDVDYYEGRPIQWQGANSGHILKSNSGNLNKIFLNTMRFIGAGFSNDEQAIKAMTLSIQDNKKSGCYRDKAGLAVILISDEDERSVGGNRSLSPNDYKPLGPLNTPESFIKTLKTHFSDGKRATVHSIVVKDRTCQDQQSAQGEKSFFGRQYMSLSERTGGTVQSLCASDYTLVLERLYERIRNTLGAITLSCKPQQRPTVRVNNNDYTQHITVNGDKIVFNPLLEGPSTVSGSYCCR